MKTSYLTITLALAVVCGCAAARADFDLPLELRPNGGAGGSRYISNGVPLEVGAAMDTSQLRVLGPDGKEVPAQFRVLARWWRKDNSIRWVLVDFIRSDSEPAKPTYTLVGRPAAGSRPKTGLVVKTDDKLIHIDTGAAQFEIDRKKFNLIQQVLLDVNKDGVVSGLDVIRIQNIISGAYPGE